MDKKSKNFNQWLPNKESLLLTLFILSVMYYIILIIFLQGWCPVPTVLEIAKEANIPLSNPDLTLSISDFSNSLQP
jgi:hypothetical protein